MHPDTKLPEPQAFWEIQRKKRGDPTCPQCFLALFVSSWLLLIIRAGGGRARRGRHSASRSQLCVCSFAQQHHLPESWQTLSSCSCFADTHAFYSSFSRKTLSRKTLLSTWQNQSSFNFKALGPLDVITSINRMTHPIFLLFVTYISLFSFSWQRADNCSCPWR